MGPICSGSGSSPNGQNCPAKNSKAVASCLGTLKSYTSNGCYAPENAVCQKIKTGAWGCVFTTSPSYSVNAVKFLGDGTITTTDISTSGGNNAEKEASSSAAITGLIIVVVAILAVGLTIFVIRKRRQQQTPVKLDVSYGDTPVTNPPYCKQTI